MEDEVRENSALLASTELDSTAITERLDRSKQPETERAASHLARSITPRRLPGFYRPFTEDWNDHQCSILALDL